MTREGVNTFQNVCWVFSDLDKVWKTFALPRSGRNKLKASKSSESICKITTATHRNGKSLQLQFYLVYSIFILLLLLLGRPTLCRIYINKRTHNSVIARRWTLPGEHSRPRSGGWLRAGASPRRMMNLTHVLVARHCVVVVELLLSCQASLTLSTCCTWGGYASQPPSDVLTMGRTKLVCNYERTLPADATNYWTLLCIRCPNYPDFMA